MTKGEGRRGVEEEAGNTELSDICPMQGCCEWV